MRAIVTGRSPRQLLAGALCGLASGLVLLLALFQPGGEDAMLVQVDPEELEIALQLVFAVLLGAALAVLVPPGVRAPAAAVAIGLATGLAFWTFGSLTLSPLLEGDAPTWTIDAAAAAVPSLIGDFFFGALAALLLAVTARFVPAATPAEARQGPRILIVGGGFGGVSAARRFERLSLRGHRVEVTLVSDSNFLLFTPMLAEVASGGLEAQHISTRYVRPSPTPGSGTAGSPRSTSRGAWSTSTPEPSPSRTTISCWPSAPSRTSWTCRAWPSTPSRSSRSATPRGCATRC